MDQKMYQFLLIGDSWIDFLNINDPRIESVCLPGASLYQIRDALMVELCFKNYELIIVVGGRNGGFVDNVFDLIESKVVVLSNDDVSDSFLDENDSAHPNQAGIDDFSNKIKELTDAFINLNQLI